MDSAGKSETHGQSTLTAHSYQDASTKDRMPDLNKRHENFPDWDRPTLYDVVTSMYLESWDDAEVAASLSGETGRKITPELVAGIRKEAAMIAETEPPEIRKKWIYRYRNVTVNNMVKERMFLEGKHNFLKAKRELAEDVEALVQSTPGDKLWIAVNDMLGRNNIAIELVHELLAYGKTAKKLETLAQTNAEAMGLSADEAVREAALKLRARREESGAKENAKWIGFVARILNQPEKQFSPEDVAYLIERGNLANETDAPEANFAARISRCADVFVKQPTVLERLLHGDVSHHLSSAEIAQTLVIIRSRPLMKPEELEQIHSYTRRHIAGIQIMKDIGHSDGRPEQLRVMAVKALESLQKLVVDHLCIVDFRKFFSNKEMARAAGMGAMGDLQTMLGALNELPSFEEVKARLDEFLKKDAGFPAARYCRKRFGTPGPFAE